MNRVNKTILTMFFTLAVFVIVIGGALTYGFQGVLAALGLLVLLVAAVTGIYVMRKARIYAKSVKHAEWINNIDVTPVSTYDKKWIMKHLDEYLEEIKTPVLAPITKNDGKQIMNHLDEFLAETWTGHNTITLEDKESIMSNIDLIFDINREEDRQTYA